MAYAVEHFFQSVEFKLHSSIIKYVYDCCVTIENMRKVAVPRTQSRIATHANCTLYSYNVETI